MPSYNQAHYIVDAVRSILDQDDPDWELWIVDNSTDDTVKVMQQFTDRRIRFQHIPQRMDPGSCLNWMLERAQGRDFSYVHTDNNLYPSYVRRMRAALRAHPLSLAYCDMRAINDIGRRLHIFRRGRFDLARLLSTDTLGVPFAATTELARRIGGFSAKDVADDVRFCVSSWGVAHFEYEPELLLDYRLHQGSRTEHAGGAAAINGALLKLMLGLYPNLAERNCEPVSALCDALRRAFDELDYLAEDLWIRKLSKFSAPWWQGTPKMEHFALSGIVTLPDFALFKQARINGRQTVAARQPSPWTLFRLKNKFKRQQAEIERHTRRMRSILPVWAHLSLGTHPGTTLRFAVKKFDFRTLWCAHQLQQLTGWKPVISSKNQSAPTWLNWTLDEADATLDCSSEPSLSSVR
ncbi:MAG: glycosyltransferase [Steroidobacteraceae bacterium]